MSVAASTRVKRSTSRRFSPDPTALVISGLKLDVLSVKFVVSTTSVAPSQRARESPIHCRSPGGRCARPSSGTIRASWTISLRTTTWSGVCSNCIELL